MLGLPLFLAARYRLVFPSRRLLFCAVLPASFSILMLLLPMAGWLVLALDVLLWIVAAADFATVLSARHFSATRNTLRIASLAKSQAVELELTNRSGRECWLSVKDDLPNSFEAEPDRFTVFVAGVDRLRFHYRYTPTQRGQHELQVVHLRVSSWLGLWRGFFKIPCPSTIHVYPDMKQISEYDLLAKTNRLSLMGLRRTRKIGQDNEFERLRDYTPDDNYKRIDWRTTARRRKLTVRDFQSNQSQRIIFMVDCGRMMTGTANGSSLLDYSLNAMLMLSYVALKQGDSVGMISFSNSIHNFTPARPGVKQINRLLHASFNQQPRHVESRYDEAFLYLGSHCRKRSLVILVTNLIDEINAHQIRQYLATLTGQHLPLCVLLRDREIFTAVDEVNFDDRDSLYQAAAAVEVLTWRQQVIRDLKHQGILALDVFPEKLTAAVVNQYLEIKARHLL